MAVIDIILEENRDLYLSVVEKDLPNWLKADKNELVLSAIEHSDNEIMKNAYVSALMLRYWYKIDQFYKRCKLVVTAEDCHDWLVQSILYAIDVHPWTDGGSSLYEVKNAPEMVIHRFMESRRLTFYQQLNRNNRKINSTVMSLDNLLEDYSDYACPMTEEDNDFEYRDSIIYYYNNQDYLKSFIIDAIIYDPSLEREFSQKKLCSFLKDITDSYCILFANRYDFNVDKVRSAANTIRAIDSTSLAKKVSRIMLNLRNDFRLLKVR